MVHLNEVLLSDVNFYGELIFSCSLVLSTFFILSYFWVKREQLYRFLEDQRMHQRVLDSNAPLITNDQISISLSKGDQVFPLVKKQIIKKSLFSKAFEFVSKSLPFICLVAFFIPDYLSMHLWFLENLKDVIHDTSVILTLVSIFTMYVTKLVPTFMLLIFIAQIDMILRCFHFEMRCHLQNYSTVKSPTLIRHLKNSYQKIYSYYELVSEFLSFPLLISHLHLFFCVLNNTAYSSGYSDGFFSNSVFSASILFGLLWVVQVHKLDLTGLWVSTALLPVIGSDAWVIFRLFISYDFYLGKESESNILLDTISKPLVHKTFVKFSSSTRSIKFINPCKF